MYKTANAAGRIADPWVTVEDRRWIQNYENTCEKACNPNPNPNPTISQCDVECHIASKAITQLVHEIRDDILKQGTKKCLYNLDDCTNEDNELTQKGLLPRIIAPYDEADNILPRGESGNSTNCLWLTGLKTIEKRPCRNAASIERNVPDVSEEGTFDL